MLARFPSLSRLRGPRSDIAQPTVSPAARGPVALLAHQTRFDLLSQLRNPRARVHTIAFPLVLLVVFNSVFGKGHTTIAGHRITLTEFYTPGIMAQAIVATAYAGLVISVSMRRDSGALKRRRATPVPPLMLVAGQALATSATTLLMTTVLILVAKVFYGIGYAPGALGAMYLMTLMGTVSLGCVGFAIAGLLKNADIAPPFTQLTMLPLWFISGVFVPTAGLPEVTKIIAAVFPIEHVANTLHLASVNTSFGASISLVDVAVLGGWAAVGVAVALNRFSWLPDR